MGKRTQIGLRVAGVALAGSVGCDTSGAGGSTSARDLLVVDVDAENIVEGFADGGGTYTYGQTDGEAPDSGYSTYGVVADASGIPGVCASECSCPSGTFCFAGGGDAAPFAGACTQSAGLGVGCNSIPNGCTTCECLLPLLQPTLPCVAHCEPVNNLTVVCD
jgi:hypothetical protein